MPTATPLLASHVPGIEPFRGKVRDVYDLGEHLLLVATDRISAFDWVLPTGVPDKGRVLTGLSVFWFGLIAEHLGIEHHLVTDDVAAMPLPTGTDRAALAGRSMLCLKGRVVPYECVARGYLAGSGWNEYQASRSVCGEPLPTGLVASQQLPQPIFTPATKAEQGDHDENVSYERMRRDIGDALAGELREQTLRLYGFAADHALKQGLLLADTKFEFAQVGAAGSERLILIDEALTPDSSRYWPAEGYQPGQAQPSFDKQYVRDWLLASDWDRASPPPALPAEVVLRTREKYIEAFERLTGRGFTPAF
ncbi:phosphoribosylaminoimidazolesuccinocarboxamide synthase [Botrimarina hoheduenensis]|uniref:Phosphoribosylaminoimidazole-succinocarboxamide synthase n=1 Tax=Botrimarina hoheduenensis TaxID=2528000 RepID=A0A5C5W0V4_9BACT|nr:phosphoribosylaminoimidazolesuccinocarboxamide synthase [Botrimarina hoheduenensis]TWT43402.1 Phosphoribosylaminoimidazole-succinocarboxamide synthase [Botrimarina hoheduenensis]